MAFIYETRIIPEHESLIDKLNEWSKDGWELVQYENTKQEHRENIKEHDIWFTRTEYFKKCLIKKELTQ